MSEDICDKLVRFNEHKQCISTDLEVEAAAEITRLRNDLRNAIFSERDYVKEIERQDVLLREENARLQEENARYKLTYAKYVEATDRMNGTPCEQIRHQQEVEALREENARLKEALEKFNVYLILDTDNDHDTRPVMVWHLRAARAALKEPGDEKTGI